MSTHDGPLATTSLPRMGTPLRLATPALLLLLAQLTACSRGDAAPPSDGVRPVPVEVAGVELRDVAPPVMATGAVSGKEELTLAFSVGGVIARITVDEGATVRPGQLLAELSPTPVASEVAKAEQGREKAERDLARVRALHADSIATTEQLQDATTALTVAEQNVRIARFSLEHAVIRATAPGVVLRRSAEPHQVIAAGDPVLVVRSAQRGVVLRAGLPDRDAMRVRLGDVAVVTFDALPGERYDARVTQRASAASAASGTYDVELTLEPRAEALASGLVGRAAIRTRGLGTQPMVPLEAVVEADGDSATLFVVDADAGRGLRRRVRLGPLMGDMIVVAEGVRPGERVVVRGAAYLDDSTRLSVRATPSAQRVAP